MNERPGDRETCLNVHHRRRDQMLEGPGMNPEGRTIKEVWYYGRKPEYESIQEI
jgi:hypothetical protein